jgi:hypothetical protein
MPGCLGIFTHDILWVSIDIEKCVKTQAFDMKLHKHVFFSNVKCHVLNLGTVRPFLGM